MLYTEKQKLFQNFLLTWGDGFSQVLPILRILNSYPMWTFVTGPLILEGLEESQLEWVALLAQQEHPVEKEFLKEFWVPIQQNEYSFFMDISSEQFEVFRTHYIPVPTPHYKKECYISDMRPFLLNLDDPSFDMATHMKLYRYL